VCLAEAARLLFTKFCVGKASRVSRKLQNLPCFPCTVNSCSITQYTLWLFVFISIYFFFIYYSFLRTIPFIPLLSRGPRQKRKARLTAFSQTPLIGLSSCKVLAPPKPWGARIYFLSHLVCCFDFYSPVHIHIDLIDTRTQGVALLSLEQPTKFIEKKAITRKVFPSSHPTMAELFPPVTARILDAEDDGLISLELQDGAVYQGYSFGAEKSVAGELVFQTGMVGYPESITDPSYRGQILVITFPLVGNYGVPSRDTMDDLLKDLPAHFESSQIHIAGLITASYSGEDFSHFLATSSLGTWLKEQGVPAIYGVDTRALTKRIRQEGSMLGRMLLQKPALSNGHTNGLTTGSSAITSSKDWRSAFETIEWVNPNERNLVADGKPLRNPDPQQD